MYYVIDGQQRLSTTVIFMSCLYRELKKRFLKEEIKDSDGDEIQEKDIERIYESFIKYSKFFKLSTVSDDKTFFERTIYKNEEVEPKNNSQRRIIEARDTFSKWFESDKIGASELFYYKDIVASATITVFEVKDKYQATQIFAFQNDRGKSLTELEKLKAEIMHKVYTYAIDDREASDAIDYIKHQFALLFSCIENLEYTKEDTVLSYHSQAYFGWEEDGIDYLKKHILTESEDKVEWLKEFTDNVLKSYESMVEIEKEFYRDSKIADAQILDKSSSSPLFIKLFNFNKNDVGKVNTVATYVEKILFKMKFRYDDFRTNNLVSIAKSYSGDIDKLIGSLQYISNNGFKDYWDFNGSCERYFTDWPNHYASSIKYVLWKYENYLRTPKREVPLSGKSFMNEFGHKNTESTLDHITPQDPDFTTYTEDFRKLYLNNIGNLSLMGWGNNSSKGNHNPVDYADYYDSSYYSMKKVYNMLTEHQSWGEKEIIKRRDDIVQFIRDNWLS